MSHCVAFDSVLASLAGPFQRQADTLLDLREWVGQQRVGACVKAYFELYEEAAEAGDAAYGLTGFRRWLENHLEIAVLDGKDSTCLETWPLALAGESDLESFCRKTMDRLREDRCHQAALVHLEFRFRTEVREAA